MNRLQSNVLLIILLIYKTWAQPNNTTEPLTVCISHVAPFVFCDGIHEDDYTGFDVSLFKDAALRVGLGTIGVGYHFKCMDSFQEMLVDTGKGICDVALSSITVTVDREKMGIKFTYPYLSSQLGIMVATTGRTTAGWNWTQPFSWDLWLATAITLMIFPICVVLIEFGSLKNKIRPRDGIRGTIESASMSLWTMFGGETYEVSSFGAKVAVICFAFMALILSSSYTANLASILTANQLNSEISSVVDLRGKAITTNEIYQNRLKARYGIESIPLVFTSDDSVMDAAYRVMGGSLAAVVTDMAILSYISHLFDNCEVKILPQGIEPFTIGMAMSPNMPHEEVRKFSSTILQMQEDDTIDRLRTDYQIGSTPACSEVISTEISVAFADVWGLWVILLAGTLIGFVSMLITRFRRKRRMTRLISLRNKPDSHSGDFIMKEKTSALENSSSLLDDDSDDSDDDNGDDRNVLPTTNPASNKSIARTLQTVAEESDKAGGQQ